MSAIYDRAALQHLFRGRDDIYPVRWQSKASGKSGYSPACANEWREGACDKKLNIDFAGKLRLEQEAAVAAMLHHETGVLCAPTAFGKAVIAAAMIARHRVNTLILVQRTDLLEQWRERLQSFLNLEKGMLGTIGGGRAKPSDKIDIALMQSLSRKGDVKPLVEGYGHVIVDECHHIGARSFEAILKRVKAKYVLGLTATPIRRDGQDPIIFMQCGPLR
jgi:superfamily II DNA or RNA helicase